MEEASVLDASGGNNPRRLSSIHTHPEETSRPFNLKKTDLLHSEGSPLFKDTVGQKLPENV